jgi:hypothetical protein
MRRQRPIKGGREPLPSCVLKDIRDAVNKAAVQYDVSRSFVVAVALAEAFGIRDQEHYADAPPRKRRTR